MKKDMPRLRHAVGDVSGGGTGAVRPYTVILISNPLKTLTAINIPKISRLEQSHMKCSKEGQRNSADRLKRRESPKTVRGFLPG